MSTIDKLKNIAAEPFRLTPEMDEEIPTARDSLLTTRQSTHGDFAENARVSQIIKEAYRSSPGWEKLTDIERESMDMIALKFSRVLSGKSMEYEHWIDIRGYSELVVERCNK